MTIILAAALAYVALVVLYARDAADTITHCPTAHPHLAEEARHAVHGHDPWIRCGQCGRVDCTCGAVALAEADQIRQARRP